MAVLGAATLCGAYGCAAALLTAMVVADEQCCATGLPHARWANKETCSISKTDAGSIVRICCSNRSRLELLQSRFLSLTRCSSRGSPGPRFAWFAIVRLVPAVRLFSGVTHEDACSFGSPTFKWRIVYALYNTPLGQLVHNQMVPISHSPVTPFLHASLAVPGVTCRHGEPRAVAHANAEREYKPRINSRTHARTHAHTHTRTPTWTVRAEQTDTHARLHASMHTRTHTHRHTGRTHRPAPAL
jgi:hypothetical protein